jgi:very-short-patch-repair endonuclease
VVEVDGWHHETQREKDARRTAFLESQGYRVIRFWNSQVLRDTESVLRAIHAALMQVSPSPRPSPPRGEGEQPPALYTGPARDKKTK